MSSELYAKPVFVGHSLWLIPDAVAEQELHVAIQSMAERLGTPPFLPHMTLLGGVRDISSALAAEKTKQLAERLRAIDAEIATVTYKDQLYFQCVFGLLVASDDLHSAHRTAKEVFDRVDEPDFMPHISLIYGDLSSADRKSLAQELDPRFHGSTVKMEKLQLWNTTGAVADWRMVAEFPLTH